MPRFTVDTSTIISRRLSDLPDNFLFSSVVLLERMAGAKDETERKQYEALYHSYREDNSLILPNAADWLLASKILFWLSHRRRKQSGGRLAKLKTGASQRMALDALLAASARRWKATIITENYDDFKAMQYYIKGLKIIRGSDFFKR